MVFAILEHFAEKNNFQEDFNKILEISHTEKLLQFQFKITPKNNFCNFEAF